MKIHFLSMAALLLAWTATISVAAVPASALIPLPQKMEVGAGTFDLSTRSVILTDAACRPVADQLAARLRKVTGYAFSVRVSEEGKPSKGSLVLTTRDAKPGLGDEGYTLQATQDHVIIRAEKPAGVFYGVQTLLQLLPPEVFGPSAARSVRWQMPCVQIEDQPRFKWRGVMLDVSRHFFNKEEVKKVLNTLAAHKGNTLHWHLVDDHGWRVQIEKYPKLTEVGAWRSGIGFGLDPKDSVAYREDGRYGGFFTREDIREILAYAEERNITIVPEIEMPGHSVAVLAAYPQLSCSGEPYSTDVPAGVHAGIYCPGKEETFEFIENVLSEIIEIFPSKYIHIGGDEVPKENWKKCAACQARMKQEGLKDERELQSYFTRRVEKFIASKQRILMGWSEISEGGLAQNATVMDWIGGAVEAASAGHDVVMSPTGFCYLDYYQSGVQALEPKAIGGYLPLEKVYSLEPIPAKLEPQFQKHILGAQGNLWSEYIPSMKQLEYMAFPRLAALMEVTWSSKESRDYEGFKQRLQTQYRRYDQMGVAYRPEIKIKIGSWEPSKVSTNASVLEWDISEAMKGASKAGASFSYVRGAHGLRLDWAALVVDGKEVARDTHAGFAGSAPRKPGYLVELPAGKTGKKCILRAQLASEGGTDSFGEVYLETKK